MSDTPTPESPSTFSSTSAPPPAIPAAPGAAPRRPPTAALTYLLIGLGIVTSVIAVAATRRAPLTTDSAPATEDVTATAPAAAPVPAAVPAPAAAIALPPGTQQATSKRPRVEIVFALDTTSSMSGLIEGAKRKIWSIASFVAQGQPSPDLRIGLVGYRDVGDEYVTRLHDLDDDLDRVSARLHRFRAEGGGDTPEHVARALDEAVRKISWSRGDDVLRLIYLVGDAPPHVDYDDGYDFARAARAAAGAGIAVHTVRCGEDRDTESVFRRIASLGRGQFMTVQQDGGMREVATPFDDELARLHDRLGSTVISYGAGAGHATASLAAARAAPTAVKVERARYLSTRGRAVGGAGDLVADVASGAVTLEAMAPGSLPSGLRALSPPLRAAHLQEKQKERAAISRQIEELGRKREAHLERERATAAKAGASAGAGHEDGFDDGFEDGFDAVAKRSLRRSVEAQPALGLKL